MILVIFPTCLLNFSFLSPLSTILCISKDTSDNLIKSLALISLSLISLILSWRFFFSINNLVNLFLLLPSIFGGIFKPAFLILDNWRIFSWPISSLIFPSATSFFIFSIASLKNLSVFANVGDNLVRSKLSAIFKAAVFNSIALCWCVFSPSFSKSWNFSLIKETW